jgi:hypothetical protein
VGVVGFLSIGMGVNTSGLGKGLKQAEGMFGSFSARIEGLGKGIAMVGAAFAGLKAVQVAKDAIGDVISAGAALESSLAKSSLLFGQDAGTITNAAQGMATKMGTVKSEFIGAATDLGNSFASMGAGKAEAAGLGVELAKLGTDLAAVSKARPEEAFTALSAAIRGEFDPLERFGIALKASQVEAKALEMGLAPTADALTELDKRFAAMELIRGQGKQFEGAAEALRGTVGSATQELTDRIQNMKESVGEAFGTITGSLAAGASGVLAKIQAGVEGNVDAIRLWAATSIQEGGLIYNAIDYVGMGIGLVADGIYIAMRNFKTMRLVATVAIKGIVQAIDFLLKGIDKALTALGKESHFADFTTAWVDELGATVDEQLKDVKELWTDALPSERLKEFTAEFKSSMAEMGRAAEERLKKSPITPDLMGPSIEGKGPAKGAAKVAAGPLPGGLDLFGAGALMMQIQAISKTIDLQALAAPKLAGAVQLGSTEARSSILRNQGVGTDVQKKSLTAQQGTHVESKKTNQLLEKLVNKPPMLPMVF